MSSKEHSPESSPLNDLTYDVITIIHEKAKGLEAFEKYLEDAEGEDDLTQLLEKTREQDQDCIEELQTHLARLLAESGYSEEDQEDEEDESDIDEDEDARKQA